MNLFEEKALIKKKSLKAVRNFIDTAFRTCDTTKCVDDAFVAYLHDIKVVLGAQDENEAIIFKITRVGEENALLEAYHPLFVHSLFKKGFAKTTKDIIDLMLKTNLDVKKLFDEFIEYSHKHCEFSFINCDNVLRTIANNVAFQFQATTESLKDKDIFNVFVAVDYYKVTEFRTYAVHNEKDKDEFKRILTHIVDNILDIYRNNQLRQDLDKIIQSSNNVFEFFEMFYKYARK
ncbi:hypothetical protein [Thermococcus paralvinellae]|uniref:Uncharacterized protein n=1 Tax=Thermococcus paralvinellae TaxID=582419 RepID=W0I5G3_9EURY|nr:hypothetical protein [Thermococcus paralvinellae]AHF81309.1 Hypothetical protein TES1_1934 [Thermococcus paralvinellae]